MKIRDLFTDKIRDVQIGKNRITGKKSNCRCHHPSFSGNNCTYRTCTHSRENHYGMPPLLSHDKDSLDDGDFILSNVEAEITRHPEHFIDLAELLNWINEGLAKCHCGFPIRRQDLRFYQGHDEGLAVPYQDTKCWIFSHCPNCGYDYNFQKILRQKSWRHKVDLRL
jgi:hypothetical protein